ncbi:hypothetical protein L1887_27464 [Cichorium endivia]|nr:hypothetical protein L1887_27464 [Cichorium endivia]
MLMMTVVNLNRRHQQHHPSIFMEFALPFRSVWSTYHRFYIPSILQIKYAPHTFDSTNQDLKKLRTRYAQTKKKIGRPDVLRSP